MATATSAFDFPKEAVAEAKGEELTPKLKRSYAQLELDIAKPSKIGGGEGEQASTPLVAEKKPEVPPRPTKRPKTVKAELRSPTLTPERLRELIEGEGVRPTWSDLFSADYTGFYTVHPYRNGPHALELLRLAFELEGKLDTKGRWPLNRQLANLPPLQAIFQVINPLSLPALRYLAEVCRLDLGAPVVQYHAIWTGSEKLLDAIYFNYDDPLPDERICWAAFVHTHEQIGLPTHSEKMLMHILKRMSRPGDREAFEKEVYVPSSDGEEEEEEEKESDLKMGKERFSTYELVVKTDYDGYFEAELRAAIQAKLTTAKHKLRHKKFVLTAGAYRAYDYKWTPAEDDPDTLCVDFYSVGRHHGVSIGHTFSADGKSELFDVL
jgi:hypothetical protein